MRCTKCKKLITKEYWQLKLEVAETEDYYCTTKCLLENVANCWQLPKRSK